MIRKGLVDQYYNILDLPRFRAYVSDISRYAGKYGITERLFFEENDRAIPNTQAFQLIDFRKGIKYPENEWVKDQSLKESVFYQNVSEESITNKTNSKLYQDLLKFTRDEEEAASLWLQTKTPEFKSWFGNSKVVDENGEPLLVWHGTEFTQDINTFKKGSSGGIFFTDDPRYAVDVKGNLRLTGPYFLSIQHPEYHEEIDNDVVFYINTKKDIDGVIGIDFGQSFSSDGQTYVVYNPNQIKSIFNFGQYSNSDNIYYQQREHSPKQITPQVKEQLLSFLQNVNPDFRVEVIKDLSANGLVNIPEFLIQLKEGREDIALSEETAHVFVELLNDKKLKSDLMNDVVRTKMYKWVIEEYGELYGMDYEKLKKEAAAKLISLYIQDKDAFNYWSGSQELNKNLGGLIQRVINWLKRIFSPYSVAALRILKGDTLGIDVALASQSSTFYQVDTRLKTFETIGDDLTKYDKVFINLNNTLLDYKNYQQEPVIINGKEKSGKVVKSLFFSNLDLRGELDKFYSTASLTKLGRELKDKIGVLNPRRVIVFTDAPLTDALVERIEDEFGPVTIRRTGFNRVETVEDEDGNPIDRVVNGSEKDSFILKQVKDNPNQNILFIDNQRTELFNQNKPNLTLKFYSNESASYTDVKTLQNREVLKRQSEMFSQGVIDELSKINKKSLLPLVQQSTKMVRNAISKLRDEELTKLFKDEFGNVTLPLNKAQKIERLLENTDTFEKGLLEFVHTIESTRYFFNQANQNKYEALRELIEEDTPDSVDKAVKETAVLMRMILSWEQWVEGVQPYLMDTKIIKGVINEFRGEIKEANDQLNKIALDVLSKQLEEQWKPHNEGVELQYSKGLISKEDRDRRIYTAQKLVNWLQGKEGDLNTASAWFENPLMTNEPIIQAISRKLEIDMIGAEKKAMDESVQVNKKLWNLGEKIGLSDEQIGERLTYVDQTNQWEDGKMVQKPTLTYLNPWQNTWMLKAKKQQVKDLYLRLVEARQSNSPDTEALELEFKTQKDNLGIWIQQNWYDEVTPEGKNIYKFFGIEDEIFELAKERQKEIYKRMREYTDTLQQTYLTEAQEEEANKGVEYWVRQLRLLRNEYTPEGELKQGLDLEIAKKLKDKSLIDRQIYDYKLNKKLFLDSIKEQIVSISDESVRETLLLMVNTENLIALKNYAEQNAPQTFIDWLDRNTRTKYSDSFYETRKGIIEKIKEISNDPTLDNIWKEISNISSFLRDKDLTLDASDSTPGLQEKIKQFQVYIESLSKNDNLELRPLISQLSALQSKSPTEFYNQVMYDWLKDIYPGISSSTNYTWLINQKEFKDFLLNSPKEFREWFDRNHFVKEVWDEELLGKVPKLVPTYIWMKVNPNDPNDVEVIPGWKYNTRTLKDSAQVEFNGETTDVLLRTTKIDWVTWNPVERTWLPKSDQFKNKEYERLKNSTDEKDKLLFEYLTTLTDYSNKVQLEGNKDSVLGFTVPFFHKKYTEGGAIKTALKNFTNRVNPREEGTESEKKTTSLWKKVLAFSGIETPEQEEKKIRTDYLGNKVKTVYTPYTTWLDPKDVTKNLILSATNYANGVYKVKALVNDLPGLNLLEQIFEQFVPKEKGTVNQFGQMIDAGTNNRLKVLQHIVDSKVYGNFREMELTRGIDRFLTGIRNLAAIGSQSDLNLPNSVKNWLQQQAMNYLFVKDRGWASRRSLTKAMKDTRTSYFNYVYQMGQKNKSLDYYLLSFFNPLLERRTQDFSRSARSTELQDRIQYGIPFYSATASEFNVYATLLYAHLFDQDVTINGEPKKLYDAFTLENGILSIKAGTVLNGKEIGVDYINDLKLRFKMMMEDVGGKQWNQTMAQRYSVWQSLEFFKKFFITMFRKRFFTKRENIELGETEGIYITTFKYMVRMLQGWIDSTNYNQALTPLEKRNLAAARDELLLSIATLFIISYFFGFDDDDKDKYKKLSDRTWLENMALLIAINTKRETDSLTPFPFLSIQNSVYPPILNETYQFITNPFVGFQVVNEGRKMLDSLLLLGLGDDKAFYDKDMPAYLIEKGDAKFVHYLQKVVQIDNFLYLDNPDKKIQVIIQSQNR